MIQISPVAISMIEQALGPIIVGKRRDINRIELHVSCESKLAQCEFIDTKHGRLKIRPIHMIPKGYSYLMEKPGKPKRSFAWVSKKNAK
ncbi:hypothetical protein [Paenibacillus tyrfis]|uniref:Uncharacterized protein n=1 Tax=Paenibacillus tyrfis TaxID=1501230 RepID=A0A081NWN4_9BACL|nr:hypothetical protein [Paenibacillus tyrfis]KEQ22857.1 hypothetical protein ET33_21140 [Paenibacillus tyrfis]